MAGKSLLPPPPGAGIIASFIKSGRTWLRFMLAQYLADLHGLGPVDLHSLFTIVPNNDDDPVRGRAVYAHAGRPKVPRVLCEHLIWSPFDPAVNPTVVMVRQPVDTMVSAYFMETRQSGRLDVPLAAYLRTKHGIARWISYHNLLMVQRGGPGVTWISYEQLTLDPEATFARVLDRLGIRRDPAAMARAIAAAQFDRMAALENEQGFPGNSADPADPQGRRMREGRIGASAALLSDDDRQFVARKLDETLHPAARERLLQLGCNL